MTLVLLHMSKHTVLTSGQMQKEQEI